MPFPTPDQQHVIEHKGAPLVVVAGPGTGKTTTIVARMMNLLLEDPARNITFVTFTRTSRRDTLKRLNKEFTDDILDQEDLVTPRVGTLHAAARSIAHKFAHKIGMENDFTILITDKDERYIVIEDTLADLGISASCECLGKALYYYLCNHCISEAFEITKTDCQSSIDYYFKLLSFYNALGMEELMLSAVRILSDKSTVVPPIFLQVDEYQDLNPVDQQFVSLIASNPTSQVVVVGDDAQSIYGRRYAHFEGLRELWDSKEWETIRFLNCHRLPPHIQRASLALISEQHYLGSEIAPQPDNGKRVQVFQCTLPEYQAEIVIKSIIENMAKLKKNDGKPIDYYDILVLCPSKTLIPGILHAFEERGIPAKQLTKTQIPDDVWKLILIIRIAFQNDNIAFRQWLVNSHIPIEQIHKYRREAMESKLKLFDYCISIKNDVAIQLLESIEKLRESTATIDDLVSSLLKINYLDIPAEQLRNIVSSLLAEDQLLTHPSKWLGLLYRKFGLLEDEDEPINESAVRITSFHSAKGLEAEVVYLTWMNERYMPMPDRDMEEQRRLLYVGMTRAKQELYLTFHEQYEEGKGRIYIKAMSHFLRGITDYLSVNRICAKDLR